MCLRWAYALSLPHGELVLFLFCVFVDSVFVFTVIWLRRALFAPRFFSMFSTSSTSKHKRCKLNEYTEKHGCCLCFNYYLRTSFNRTMEIPQNLITLSISIANKHLFSTNFPCIVFDIDKIFKSVKSMQLQCTITSLCFAVLCCV